MGSYHKSNTKQSAIWSGTWIKGFSKAKNGFAQIGLGSSLEAKYKINSYLNFIFLCGYNVHSVDTKGMSEYLTEMNANKEIVAEEANYKYFYLAPGFGYNHSIRKLDLSFDLFCGYAIATYPFYKFILVYTDVNNPMIFTHVGPMPNLGSILYGFSLSSVYNISKKIKIGIYLQFQTASYSYNVYPMSIPGGSPHQLDFTDRLSVSVINIGPKISYRF
jgi:hypothetical protein